LALSNVHNFKHLFIDMAGSEAVTFTQIIGVIGVFSLLVTFGCFIPRLLRRLEAFYTAWEREFRNSILLSVEDAFNRRNIPIHYRSDEAQPAIVHIHNELPRSFPATPNPTPPAPRDTIRRPRSH
jgi:hypothetical protein